MIDIRKSGKRFQTLEPLQRSPGASCQESVSEVLTMIDRNGRHEGETLFQSWQEEGENNARANLKYIPATPRKASAAMPPRGTGQDCGEPQGQPAC